MNYRIIKIIPLTILALGTGIPYIIYEPMKFLSILTGLIVGVILFGWYDHFEKKARAQHE